MAGSLAIGNGVTTTTLVLDGVQADIDSTMRLNAKKFGYTGDPDLDAIAGVTEFVVESGLAALLDTNYSSQAKIDAVAAANVSVASILLPGAISTV